MNKKPVEWDWSKRRANSRSCVCGAVADPQSGLCKYHWAMDVTRIDDRYFQGDSDERF